jgi:glycosyltransferase involved in cell wall biosynthesis
LIEASADAIRVIPSLQIIVAGEGPSKEHLVQKTAALGLNDKVHFLGLRKDVSDLLAATDLYICSSDREGISLSILEAMAAERPVIATAVGGNLELIQHDETGLLIKKGDRDALVQAILSLSLDAQARSRLGQQARQSIEANFSLNRMLLDYDHLYQSMMTARANVGNHRRHS